MDNILAEGWMCSALKRKKVYGVLEKGGKAPRKKCSQYWALMNE